MRYPGYAFRENERAEMDRIRERYQEISHLIPDIEIRVVPGYAHARFEGKLLSDEAKALSEEDLLIIADRGNLCFGGYCDKVGTDEFVGKYYTD